MGIKIQLGGNLEQCVTPVSEPSDKEKFAAINKRLAELTTAVLEMRGIKTSDDGSIWPAVETTCEIKGCCGIPINTMLIGKDESTGNIYFMSVNEDSLNIGSNNFGNLKDATYSIINYETDVNVFWKTSEGVTVQELIKGDK